MVLLNLKNLLSKLQHISVTFADQLILNTFTILIELKILIIIHSYLQISITSITIHIPTK